MSFGLFMAAAGTEVLVVDWKRCNLYCLLHVVLQKSNRSLEE